MLQRSVERRLIADVRISTSLSSGTDSTSVAALTAQLTGTKIKAFSTTSEHRVGDETALSKHCGGRGMVTPLGDYYKFSIARNPWDRVVSDFSWQARNRPELQPVRRWYHKVGVPFDEFEQTLRRFRAFVAGDWKTNDHFYLPDDELCVDFVIRYERLNDDLAEVCRRVGLPPVTLPRLKAGLRKDGHSYRDYYDEVTKSLVAERHHHDIRLFGYQF